MSCWVVPTVAAELWGVTVQQVLEQIRAGCVTSKTELGFTVVDVAPHSPTVAKRGTPHHVRPPTFVAAAPGSTESDQIDWENRRRIAATRLPPRALELALV